LNPWWMRPTAEGLEEGNRNKPTTENPPEPAQAPEAPEPAPPTPVASFEPARFEPVEPEPPRERPFYSEEPREWGGEPVSPVPVFGEEEPRIEAAAAHPLPVEEPHEPEEEAEEPYDEDEEELEASEAEREDGEVKEGEDKDAEGRRRRRSRGRRGGRRRNGNTAASPTAWRDEPAVEETLPTPRRFTPVPSPSRYVISPSEVESVAREIVISVPDRQRADQERKIAMFCDLENIALGVRDSEISKFDINLVLERLVEKGKIIVKKAYADWERYSDYKRPFHEAAIELIDIPQKYYSGKNSADIKMVVDAMDLSYSKEHLDTFVLLSGDSDFSPLVSKLKENNKYVIGIGVKNSSSNLLVDNCDEFIYYEDVWRDSQKGPKLDGLNKKTAEAFSLMIESIQALIRENKDVLWGSMIKQTMQRKKPSFNEGYYGYSTFSEMLEDAERKQILKLKKDQRSGTYIVTGFAKSGEGMAAAGRR